MRHCHFGQARGIARRLVAGLGAPMRLQPFPGELDQRRAERLPRRAQRLGEAQLGRELAACLEAEGLVHQVARRGSEVGLTLALPPERVPIARLLELASRSTLGARPRTEPGWAALAAILANAQSAAGDKTLADLL